MSYRFEWDPDKAERNLRKHGVNFEVASRAFVDPMALTVLDRVEAGEQRWQTIGLVDGVLVLLVAHTVRESESGDEIIRLISARKADPTERKRYAQATR